MIRAIPLFLLMVLCITSFAQKQYVFIFLNHKPDAEKLSKEDGEKIMKGHMENIGRLAKENKLISAGPFEGGGGMFVFNTKSVEEAKQWLSTDPGVQANRWNVEVLPFYIRKGDVCHAKEPYEMVTYHFIRYGVNVTKETAQEFPEIVSRHDDHLKVIEAKSTALIEGTFGDNEGGILILSGDLPKALIDEDPGIERGLIAPSIKTLWIAKGSFCE